MNMKKHVLLVLLLGLTTSFCYSQVKVSVQGGAGFNGITKDKNYKADFGYRFGSCFSLQRACETKNN